MQDVLHIYVCHIRHKICQSETLSHPWSRDSQGQEKFLAAPAEKQTWNYDTEAQKQRQTDRAESLLILDVVTLFGSLFLNGVQRSQGYKTTLRTEFSFYHQVSRSS